MIIISFLKYFPLSIFPPPKVIITYIHWLRCVHTSLPTQGLYHYIQVYWTALPPTTGSACSWVWNCVLMCAPLAVAFRASLSVSQGCMGWSYSGHDDYVCPSHDKRVLPLTTEYLPLFHPRPAGIIKSRELLFLLLVCTATDISLRTTSHWCEISIDTRSTP